MKEDMILRWGNSAWETQTPVDKQGQTDCRWQVTHSTNIREPKQSVTIEYVDPMYDLAVGLGCESFKDTADNTYSLPSSDSGPVVPYWTFGPSSG